MTMQNKPNTNTVVATCAQRKAAAEQYVPKSGTIVVHAQQYTQQEVEAVYQACLDARKNLVNLRGQVAATLAARKQADATMRNFDAGMRDWVATTFGPASQQAIDFGYEQKQRAKPKIDVKAQAAKKAEATKVARGYKGPKARKKIKATTPATETPSPAPVAAVPVAQPAKS